MKENKYITSISISDMDTMINGIKEINKTPIQIYHSKKDEIIPYNQALELASYGHTDFNEIDGDHNNPIFSDYCMKNMINGICNK